MNDRKDIKALNELIANHDNESHGLDWITNSTKHNKQELRGRPEYKAFKSLLFNEIKSFAQEGKDSVKAKFNSFSVAYMARWGTGKTTVIRELSDDLKPFYNTVEINLWHIANSLSSDENITSQDNLFVRQIVKEAITQLSNDPDIVEKYMDSIKHSFETNRENDVKINMLDSLLEIPRNSEPSLVINERSKFLDQHLSSLMRVTEIIFNNTLKPTIFVFDDIDRIEDDKKAVQILDSLVAFLSIRNAVYIIPVDEAKVMKSISKNKEGKDPYSYMNKYFTYSIRAPFIPRLNSKSILNSLMEEAKFDVPKESREEWITIAARLFPATYRGMKDYLNAYQSNNFILQDNTFIRKLLQTSKLNGEKPKLEIVVLFATIIQIKFPLITDYLSEDIKTKDALFDVTDKKAGTNDIKEITRSLKSQDLEAAKKHKLQNKQHKFWGAIIGRDLPNKKYNSPQDIFSAIASPSDKNNESINLVISQLSFLNLIFSTFQINDTNSSFRLLIWVSLTMAEINDQAAMEFAENIDFHALLSSNDIPTSIQMLFDKDEEKGASNE